MYFLRKCNIDDYNILHEFVCNNIINIIKSNEINVLIKECIIKNKDNVIEVQTDGITYLIHMYNAHY